MEIVAILRDLHIQHKQAGEHHHSREHWIQTDCPTCSPNSSHFRLGIHVSGSHANCWHCGSKRVADVLVALSGRTYSDILPLLEGIVTGRERIQERRGKLVLPNGIGPLLPPHEKYLARRGFDVDQLKLLWKVQGIGIHQRLGWRIFIPIERDGEVVSWTTRSTSDSVTMRYINAGIGEEAVSAKSLLYGQDYVRNSVIVCEGPLDVWAIGPGAVSTTGLAFTMEQVLAIGKYASRVICFDAESNAQRRARRLAEQLQAYPGETHVVCLETGKDPAEADKSEIEELRRRFLV